MKEDEFEYPELGYPYNGSASEFAETMLDKKEFIRSLPARFVTMARFIERNFALSNTTEREIPIFKAKLNEVQNLYVSTFPPGFYDNEEAFYLQMIRTVGDLDLNRSVGAAERRFISDQFKFSSYNNTLTRDDESPQSFLSRLSNAFKRS